MYASLNVLSQSEQQLSLDTILAIAGTVVGILGIVAGYIFYRLSIRTKEPYWSIVSNNLIQDNITQLNDLEVKYKRQKVETVTVSKILLWNKGGETIDRLDITEEIGRAHV